MTTSDIFINLIYSITCQPIPSQVREQAALCILDYKGCAIAGSKMLEEKGQSFLSDVLKQGGAVSVLGMDGVKTTLHNAVFLNAMSAHATELDDGHRKGMIHLGASILSALLPVAEVEGLSDDDIVLGTIVGYEAAIRLAMTMQPSHKVRGYHTSGTCGTIGSAMAIAAAMHFDKPQMKSALAAACASAAGLLEMQEDGSELKPYNLAHAAVAGITAAYCGKAGFLGPNDPLCGKRGMIAVMAENPNLECLTILHDYYEIERIYRKPYAACRHCHPAIEAALMIKKEIQNTGLGIQDIESIYIQTYQLAVDGHDHKNVQGIASAKLSMPFCVALALVKGSAGILDFSELNITDADIAMLMQKITVESVEDLTVCSPEKRAARVRVIAANSRTYSYQVDYPKGEPENPMSRADIEQKYEMLRRFSSDTK